MVVYLSFIDGHYILIVVYFSYIDGLNTFMVVYVSYIDGLNTFMVVYLSFRNGHNTLMVVYLSYIDGYNTLMVVYLSYIDGHMEFFSGKYSLLVALLIPLYQLNICINCYVMDIVWNAPHTQMKKCQFKCFVKNVA